MTDLMDRFGLGGQYINRAVRAGAAALLGGAGLLCSGHGVLSFYDKLWFGYAQEGVHTSFIRGMLGEDEATLPVGSILVAGTGAKPIKDIWVYRLESPKYCGDGLCSTIIFFRGIPTFAMKTSGPIDVESGPQHGTGEVATWLLLHSRCDRYRVVVDESDLELKVERKFDLPEGACK